jgi:transposase-like protein
MPWMETSPVDQRERFIRDHRLDVYAMTELCARYGISRKTGYKWRGRFEEGGRLGLRDRSRAPHHCPASHWPGRRGGDLRGASAASELGTGQTPRLASAAPPGPGVAGRQHCRRSLGAPRTGQEATPAAALAASRRRPGRDHSAQRSLDRRLQRALPHARPPLLLPADGRRSAPALSPGVPRLARHKGPGPPPHLRSALSRVWAAPRFWVELATLPSASDVRKRVMSGAAISAG